MRELSGGRALVTGGGRRLGAAVARALARAGMDVAISYQASAAGAQEVCAEIRALGRRGVPLQADLRDPGAAVALVDAALAALGGLDLLVLNAGGFEPGGVADTTAESFEQALALNLTGPFFVAQRAAEPLRASRGSIVFLTCASRLAPYRGYVSYQASKAALHQLMRVLALELAPQVRVNAVAPGSVLPPDGWDAERTNALAEHLPLRRVGTERDVVHAVLHLARSDWSTGTELVVDGGRSAGASDGGTG